MNLACQPCARLALPEVAEHPDPQPAGVEEASIAALTRRLAAAEEAAFREFHELYCDRLYHFLLLVCRGDEGEVEEALQDTFLRVVRHARLFETEAACWSWLKTVARNAVRDRGRKHRRYFALLRNFAFGSSQIPERSNEEAELAELLTESLSGWEADDRHLLEREYLHRASVKELARETGLTEKAVESRLVRLRRALRAAMVTKLRAL